MSVVVYQGVKKQLLSKTTCRLVVAHVLSFLNAPDTDVSLTFVGDCRMRTLNRQHRGYDKTTDVLSFPTDDIGSGDAGDIVISVPQIVRQARQLGRPQKEETVRMLVHGVLHLFGYDHGTKKEETHMFGIQEQLVTEIMTGII